MRLFHIITIAISLYCISCKLFENNTPPEAQFIIDPPSGNVNTIYSFDASECTDEQDGSSKLKVRWDWENDGTYDTNYSTTKTATNQYITDGAKTIKLEVKDSEGLKATTTKQVTVSLSNGYTGTMIDIDGNIYKTIQIGDQLWMAENLKVTMYRNGDTIPNVIDDTAWSNLSTGAYCNPNNDENHVATYGRLYNWYSVNDSRGLAPSGWHIPSDEEWKELEIYLGMSQAQADGSGTRNSWSLGLKLKSTSEGGTNESGFSAIISGQRTGSGLFNNNYTSFWTSTVIINNVYNWAIARLLYNSSHYVMRNSEFMGAGLSVRCIRDAGNTPLTALFVVNPTSGTTETVFTFDASWCADSEDPTSELQVRWDWENDGTWDTNYTTIKTATHQFSTPGTYSINLQVKNSGGLTDVATKTVIVSTTNTAPVASFTVSPTSGTTSTEFIFDASSSYDNEDDISALKVKWDWKNDGTWDTNYTTIKTATHQFSTPGTYTINLKVKDSGGLTITTTNTVSVSQDNRLTDIDGNKYRIVTIGNQVWMAENLKVTHYRNGDEIPNITDPTQWSTLYTGAYCNWGNDASNVETYGRLYNWYVTEDTRGLAPQGWHVASDQEWKILETFLGMSYAEADNDGYRGTDEGKKLKSTSGWMDVNNYISGNGNNVSGFSALPGGERSQNGGFYGRGGNAFFWTSTTDFNQWGTSSAWDRNVNFNKDNIYRNNWNKHFGKSIRCIKN